jgi:Domain of unknown function (DUF4145)
MAISWTKAEYIGSRKYTCGYCGQALASERGWLGHNASGVVRARIDVCHHCTRPTFFDEDGRQYPDTSHGESVNNVSDVALNQIYEEARKAISAGCFTAAVLCCRKLLMHLAVAKGAKAGESFKSYVEFLGNNNHVPAACKTWVDQIRDTGNEANHEIKMMKREDAKDLVSFCEMLLKITYEFPAVALARVAAKATT